MRCSKVLHIGKTNNTKKRCRCRRGRATGCRQARLFPGAVTFAAGLDVVGIGALAPPSIGPAQFYYDTPAVAEDATERSHLLAQRLEQRLLRNERAQEHVPRLRRCDSRFTAVTASHVGQGPPRLAPAT